MSSPFSSLKNGRKPALLPGRRAAPFKPKDFTGDDIDEQTMFTNISTNGPSFKQPRHPSRESAGTNDAELLSVVMQRLSKAEQNLRSQLELNREKDKRIKILEEKCKIMEKARGYGDEKALELERKCQSLQKEVHSMESFLEDYGMVWVGEDVEKAGENAKSAANLYEELPLDRSGYNASSRNSFWNPDDSVPGQNPFKMDFDLVGKNVKELNELAGEGEHVISHTTRGARLKIRDPIPLTLYANGIYMFNGPFRPYTDPETRTCVQDLMDGYFPSELQTRFPNGVPFLLKDLRGTQFRDKRQEKFFTGSGKQLVSSEPEEIPEYKTDRKDKASDTKGLSVTSEPPGNQRQTVDQFLNKLPSSVIKAGKIIDVRSDLKTTLKGSKAEKDDLLIIERDAVANNTNNPDDENKEQNSSQNITTLRIKSEKGDKTFVLKMKYTDTIGDVKRNIDKIRSSKMPIYQIKTSFPNRTYDNMRLTLEQCELVPTATLHLFAKR